MRVSKSTYVSQPKAAEEMQSRFLVNPKQDTGRASEPRIHQPPGRAQEDQQDRPRFVIDAAWPLAKAVRKSGQIAKAFGAYKYKGAPRG